MNIRTAALPTVLTLGVALTGLLAAAPCRAQTTEVVTLDTSALSSATSYYFDFQLVDGGLTGDGNSVVSFSDFSSTGVVLNPALTQSSGAGVSGLLLTGLTLTDTDPNGVDEFQQAFTVVKPSTSQIQFTLHLAPGSLDTPTPDTFSFAVLNSSKYALPTNGPTGGELAISSFTSMAPPLDPAYHTLSSPLLQPVFSSPVPESSTAVSMGLLFALSLGGAVVHAARRRAATVS